jgi:Flp pilus assembly protein TadG
MRTVAQFRSRLLHCRLRSDRGSAMVEFAVTASVLFMLLVGLMKVCLAVYTYHYVSEAARESVRYAVVHGSSSASPVSTNSAIQTYARGLGYPGISTSLLTTATTWDTFPDSGSCPASPAACNDPGNLVQVTVSYAFPFSIPFKSSRTVTMSSTAAMVIAN